MPSTNYESLLTKNLAAYKVGRLSVARFTVFLNTACKNHYDIVIQQFDAIQAAIVGRHLPKTTQLIQRNNRTISRHNISKNKQKDNAVHALAPEQLMEDKKMLDYFLALVNDNRPATENKPLPAAIEWFLLKHTQFKTLQYNANHYLNCYVIHRYHRLFKNKNQQREELVQDLRTMFDVVLYATQSEFPIKMLELVDKISKQKYACKSNSKVFKGLNNNYAPLANTLDIILQAAQPIVKSIKQLTAATSAAHIQAVSQKATTLLMEYKKIRSQRWFYKSGKESLRDTRENAIAHLKVKLDYCKQYADKPNLLKDSYQDLITKTATLKATYKTGRVTRMLGWIGIKKYKTHFSQVLTGIDTVLNDAVTELATRESARK